MDWFLGPGATQGEPYLPDEAAKALVAEKELKKGDTISKREIIDFLAKHGISNLLAPDVAMVLRNLFAVTPTFDEGHATSSDLLGELEKILSEDVEQSEAQEDEEDLDAIYREAIEVEFCLARGPVQEAILAKLATVSWQDTMDVVEFVDIVGEEHLQFLEDCYLTGGEPLAESLLHVWAYPHRFQFLQESVQYELTEQYGGMVARQQRVSAAKERAKAAPSPPPEMSPKEQWRQLRRVSPDRGRIGGEDPLAARAAPDVRSDQPYMLGLAKKRGGLQKATDVAIGRQRQPTAELPKDFAPPEGFGAHAAALGRKFLGVARGAASALAGNFRQKAPAGTPAGAVAGPALAAARTAAMAGGGAQATAPAAPLPAAAGEAPPVWGAKAPADFADQPAAPASPVPAAAAEQPQDTGWKTPGFFGQIGAAAKAAIRRSNPEYAHRKWGPESKAEVGARQAREQGQKQKYQQGMRAAKLAQAQQAAQDPYGYGGYGYGRQRRPGFFRSLAQGFSRGYRGR